MGKYCVPAGGRELPMNRRQRVSESGELTISQVSRNADEGDYTCTATNKQGHASSQSLPLRVVGTLCQVTPIVCVLL